MRPCAVPLSDSSKSYWEPVISERPLTCSSRSFERRCLIVRPPRVAARLSKRLAFTSIQFDLSLPFDLRLRQGAEEARPNSEIEFRRRRGGRRSRASEPELPRRPARKRLRQRYDSPVIGFLDQGLIGGARVAPSGSPGDMLRATARAKAPGSSCCTHAAVGSPTQARNGSTSTTISRNLTPASACALRTAAAEGRARAPRAPRATSAARRAIGIAGIPFPSLPKQRLGAHFRDKWRPTGASALRARAPSASSPQRPARAPRRGRDRLPRPEPDQPASDNTR
jgi:hypothetical protein